MNKIIVKIETERDRILAHAISANGFGRFETTSKGWRLIIFPEFAIMEKLFTF